MRKQIDGLAALAAHEFDRNPADRSLYVFTNKGRDKIKLLNNFRFEGTPSGANTLTALNYLVELGPTRKRIDKTIYLLNFVDDESFRRRILTQLNRTEKRHDLARVICHGQRGELRKRYREDQEDQMGALGLVVNAVVLWNTVCMQDTLNHLRQNGMPVSDSDIAVLSPLRYEYINVLDYYSFTLADAVLTGKLRPLNTISTLTGKEFKSHSTAIVPKSAPS